MNKNLLVFCITVFLCVCCVSSCTVYQEQKTSEVGIEAIKAGLQQKMVKFSNLYPVFIWVEKSN